MILPTPIHLKLITKTVGRIIPLRLLPLFSFLFLAFSNLQLSAQTATTTTVTSNNNPSCDNSNITLTATVNPNTATGTVEFFLDGVSLGAPTTLVNGVKSITISSPASGTYSITAVYTTDDPANFTGSTSPPLTQVVNASPVVNPIGGNTAICGNGTTTLTDATPGGVWSSGTPGVATVNSSGVVTGVSVGTSVISYTVTDVNDDSNSKLIGHCNSRRPG